MDSNTDTIHTAGTVPFSEYVAEIESKCTAEEMESLNAYRRFYSSLLEEGETA